MTTLREAAQQALEAMNYSGMDVGKFNRINAACAALRDALAQQEQAQEREQEQEQEPVAWMSRGKELLEFSRPDTVYGSHTIPLYTQPPRREWQRLTEEEIRAAYGKDLKYRDGDYERFARAIEAKLKEKNNG